MSVKVKSPKGSVKFLDEEDEPSGHSRQEEGAGEEGGGVRGVKGGGSEEEGEEDDTFDVDEDMRRFQEFEYSRRKRTPSFYQKKETDEIEGRLCVPGGRRTSIFPTLPTGGIKNDEVVMVPLLLGEGEVRRDSHGVDQNKYKLTYLDLISMQIYGAAPSDRVIQVLNDYYEHEHMHHVFCELETLEEDKWRERSRWVKYEECIESSGDRWSKPHVSMLSLLSLFELRKSFLQGAVMFDIDAECYSEIVEIIVRQFITIDQLPEKDSERTKELLRSRHKHGIHTERCKCITAIKDKCSRGKGKKGKLSKADDSDDDDDASSYHKFNRDFLRKVPDGCEAINILVGETDYLKQPITCFVRLQNPILLGEMPEVEIPTRFMYVLLGPEDTDGNCKEIGRSMATVMSDEVFREIAYYATDRKDLMSGLDEFMSQVTVLPPGKVDPNERIEPPYLAPDQKHRLEKGKSRISLGEHEESDKALQRTGKLFGGFIVDIKRKMKHYKSDFVDALHPQCFASFLFMYIACLTPVVTIGGLLGQATDNHIQCFASFLFMNIACLTPVVTIGGLLGQATDNHIGAIEALISAAFCGTTWHLFSGQPLTIIGATGPVLVFEKIMYPFCLQYGINYLAFRFWIGMWIALILLLIVMFDLSSLVKYITRFTEEGFAMLIALIFIVEAFKKLLHIMYDYPVDWFPNNPDYHDYTCFCHPPNGTNFSTFISPEMAQNMSLQPWVLNHYKDIPVLKETGEHSHVNISGHEHEWDAIPEQMCTKMNGTLFGSGCDTPHYVPDVFFFSCSLFLTTFGLSLILKDMKTSKYFTKRVCVFLSDFAVPIAIVSMTIVNFLVHLDTPKLVVPDEIRPTRSDRGWIVNPMDNPLWTIPAAIVPALLAAVLIFMDQQITAVIVNRKEHKLMKGCGYHLDLMIIAVQIACMSVIGTPWFVAATMESINHVRSLSRESETSVPGERPKFLGVREQRVTGFLAWTMIGLSAFMSVVLKMIPMPVLYGVFFFMGISAMRSIQLVDRILIIFMPTKYQPDYLFLRHVKISRVYLFTFIQILCLAGLWGIKTTKQVSLLFPLMVLALCFIRKAMDWLFTQDELKWLDDTLPEDVKKEIVQDEEAVSFADENEKNIEMNDVKKDSIADTNGMLKNKAPGDMESANGKTGSNKNLNSELQVLLAPNIVVESPEDENQNKTKV